MNADREAFKAYCEANNISTQIQYRWECWQAATAHYQVAAYTDKDGMALCHNDFPGAVPLYRRVE